MIERGGGANKSGGEGDDAKMGSALRPDPQIQIYNIQILNKEKNKSIENA